MKDVIYSTVILAMAILLAAFMAPSHPKAESRPLPDMRIVPDDCKIVSEAK